MSIVLCDVMCHQLGMFIEILLHGEMDNCEITLSWQLRLACRCIYVLNIGTS